MWVHVLLICVTTTVAVKGHPFEVDAFAITSMLSAGECSCGDAECPGVDAKIKELASLEVSDSEPRLLETFEWLVAHADELDDKQKGKCAKIAATALAEGSPSLRSASVVLCGTLGDDGATVLIQAYPRWRAKERDTPAAEEHRARILAALGNTGSVRASSFLLRRLDPTLERKDASTLVSMIEALAAFETAEFAVRRKIVQALIEFDVRARNKTVAVSKRGAMGSRPVTRVSLYGRIYDPICKTGTALTGEVFVTTDALEYWFEKNRSNRKAWK